MEPKFFVNDQIEPDWLPRVESLAFIELPKTYRTVLLISWSIFLIIPLLVMIGIYLFGEDVDISIGWFLLGWFVLAAFFIGRVFLTFPYKGYALRQKDIVYKRGWLWRSVTTVPFSRVQHCDVKQGLVERQFGLSSLNVYTAGGQNSDLTIPGIQFEEAERYKAFILKTISSDEEE